MLAAMLSAACFALVATQVVSTSRSAVQGANVEIVRAQLESAADAGVALALDGLSNDDANARWGIDSRPRNEEFNGVGLTIAVEDERGKIPINLITPTQAHTMFERAGAEPAEVDQLVKSFLDARDPSRVAPSRSDSAFGGGFTAVSDLAQVPGLTAVLFAAIAPSTTVNGR